MRKREYSAWDFSYATNGDAREHIEGPSPILLTGKLSVILPLFPLLVIYHVESNPGRSTGNPDPGLEIISDTISFVTGASRE
ncbi:hypothetical protein KSZ_41910 [Dictyobacter formicarum]|uniref:Uncharacterized protein n=1 Tax=Dictyobacter formicarum TaxID=2778368 RepID=A0ABQ3VJB6_9CHLR|nr:hypothetical protein KSZ_41910 [Dictyobacter formicarum]